MRALNSAKGQRVKLLSRWVERLHARLIRSDRLEKADLIFVLAGHPIRKVYGARLLLEGWAPQVLMSTGDPPYIARILEREVAPRGRARVDIQATANRPSPSRGHFFAWLNGPEWSVEPISPGWLGTLGEIKALGRWLQQRPSIRSVLIVSVGMHLRRAEMCCRRLLPQGCRIRLIAVPTDAEDVAAGGREHEGPYHVLREWSKLFLYFIILALLVRRCRG